ncbi:tetratricopeptide repeat protein [Sorangium sp. So ce128]|uniref:tetratricopeptide repeat protein n=1 Tax=Sorangium sp. So ce128 TaxID=3133281 RepID=UPI003F62F2C0
MQQDTKSARVSFRIDNLESALEQGIDNEAAALDVLVAAAAKGSLHPELWAKLHETSARHDRFSELAFAYERLVGERRFGMLPQAAQAEVLVRAAEFLADSFGDPGGARPYLERALSVLPSHQESFFRLERILQEANEPAKLADLYALAAGHRPDRAEQLSLLRRAFELVDVNGNGASDEERAIKLLQQILKVDPADASARWELEARYARAGRHQEIARMLEQALTAEAPPPDALEIRTRLIDLYSGPLKEIERALPHVEEVLAQSPGHEAALRAGEALLARKTVLVRAAAALEAAHARRGDAPEAARMMALQIENLRGPRRVEVQKRLVELQFQRLGDLASAFSLSEQILAVDPSDEAVRERFVALASALDRQADAARVLVRASAGAKDKPLKARIAAELGELYEGLGDGRKARASFQQALDGEPDDAAARRAARGLAKLCERERDARGLAGALERLAEAEPEAEAREAAAERLARLYEEELGDAAGAIAAYRRLAESGSSREPGALAALERLYEATSAHEGLAWVLERRAEAEPDRRAARELAFRAAELRTRLADLPAAVAAWRRYLAAFGPSREAHARLVPLLEQERRWAELEALLEAEAELAAGQDRASVLARIGAIRMARLDDPAGAIVAYREALALDPTDRPSRLAVEKMLGAPPGNSAAGAESSRQSSHLLLTDDQRLAACAVLEPIARAEKAAPLLVRVLETKAELGPVAWAPGASAPTPADVSGRLAALEEAASVAERELRDPKKALDLSARGLSLATAYAPERLARWVAEVERLTEHGSESARRAPALAGALGDRAVDSPALSHLARRAGEALLASGDVTQALALYRRALAFEPSSLDLIARVDALLREQGSPEERLALYREALAQPCAPARRRELLHAIGTIQRRDVGDLAGAAATYRAAIEDDAGDDAAYEALLDTYAAGGAWGALYGALAERLPGVAPDARVAHELRMADAAARGGEVPSAVAHYRASLSSGAALDGAALAAMEALALSAGDPALLREVLERRVAAAGDPLDEALWLERLGELAAFGIRAADAPDAARAADAPAAQAAPGDLEAAVTAWQRAAGLAEGPLADPERAQKLYERVLSVAPKHRDAAARLAALYRGQGAWARLAAVCEVLLDTAASDDEAFAALAALEDAAIRARATSRFVDAALDLRDRMSADGEGGAAAGRAAARARAIEAALARVLAADPERQDDAASVYRRLLSPQDDGDAALGALDAAALEAFRAFLAQSPDTLARRVDRRWLFTLLVERGREGERPRALSAWAAWEEEIGNRAAAAALYARLLEADPENDDALAARGRLLAEVGDHEGAAEVLAARRDRSQGSARVALDVELATLLFDRLDRPADALDAVAPAIEAGTIEPAVIEIVQRALGRPETQARAALLLERACDALDDPEARVALLEALLASSPADAAPGALLDAGSLAAAQRAAVRRGWFERLLDHHDHDAPRGLGVALRAVSELPGELALWDRLEELGRRAKQPERVAAAHAAALDAGAALPPDIVEEIGRRAVEHHEEWFDAPETALALLRRLVELVPGSLWGFERLKLAYNAAERWEDLFALYDAMLERTSAADERVFLLEDAAAVARDLAGDGERTMRYLEQLLPLQDDARTRAALERLYERHGRHRPLIDLLSAELPRLSGDAADRLRERVALLWIEGVGDAASALPVVEKLLDAPPEPRAARAAPRPVDAFALLERILGGLPPEQAPAGEAGALAARQRSAALLAKHYREEARPTDLVRVLEIQLEGADAGDRPALLREIVRLRRDALGDEPGAFARLAELVELTPSEAGDRAELAELAERLGRHDRLAEVLAAAEPRAGDARQALSLVRDAALLRRDRLGDADGAIALFRRLFSLAEASGDAESARDAARALDRLFAEADRVVERCDVLDTLAAIETDPAARREALGELARLASSRLGDEARAIAAYSARLVDDRQDLAALDGLAALLEEGGRYRELTAVLERRAAVRGGAGGRRDLGRVARLFERELGDADEAIATWRRIREELAPDPESGNALAALYTRAERWGDLVALLEVEASAAGALPGGAGAARSVELFQRLGDTHRDRTLAWELAVKGYRRAHEAERNARRAGVEGGGGEGEGGEGEWGAAEGGERDARSPAPRAGLEELLRRIDPASAEHRGALVAAVGALLEICADADDWRGQIALLEPRLTAAGTDAERVAILKASAALLEERGDDREGAFELAFRAFLLSPGAEPPEGLLRLTDLAGRWHTIADALPELERRGDVPAATLRDLTARVGRWHRDARADEDAAERAFERALLHDPANRAILLDLAELLRRRRGPSLVPTLLRLAAATGHDLALYREAVEAARDAGDAARAREIAAELLDLAVQRLVDEEEQPPAPGAWPASRAALWAIDALVGMLAGAGDRPQIVALCRRGAALPFASSERRRLLRVAAEAAEPGEAIALYGGLFADDPTDESVGESLAALLRAARRREELVRLRELQIEVSGDLERRVALRYDAAELLADATRASEAIALLRRNLAESPGHGASIDRLASLLEAGGLHRELMLLREEQAAARGSADAGTAAAELWLQAASLAEHELNEPERAIVSYRRAADIGSVEALDALARLLARRGEHAAAAEALERLCAGAAPEELHQAALRLADAYLAAGEPDRARAALERALPRAAQPAPLRERLAYLYRASGAWSALAALIAGDAARADEAPARLSLLREAADLYLTRGGSPAAAIPLFDEAIALAPDDLSLRLARSRALSAAGRTDDATAALRGIIADFGARRPKERALVHYELARVALATGDRARAMAEFDLALRVDPAHPDALHGLAGLALEDGQLERAHRAYRALLLVARRPRDEGEGLVGARRSTMPPMRSSVGLPPSTSFSRAEVLLALGEIARRQGAPEREAEYVESAFEAARESDAEHEKLLAALRARGRHDLLARALEARLAGPAEGPAEDAAAALGELASLYEGPLDRPELALSARLRALDLTPGAGAAHDAALELARRSGQTQRYLDLVERLVARAASEPYEVALLLRFGRALELSPADQERAAAVYRRAEAKIAAGAPPAGRDAGADIDQLWSSLEAIYARLGDRAAQADVLGKRIGLADAPAASTGVADRAGPRYRLAALLAADAADVDQAISLLEEALDLHADPDRAEAILRDALRTDPRNPRAIRLFERLARQSGRPRALVDALLLLAEIEGPGVLEEAVRTARALGDRGLAESILLRIVGSGARSSSGSSDSSDPSGSAWALVALAELREEAGDLAAAASLCERAARASAPEEERALLLHAAELAAGPLADLSRAARLYEELRAREPAEREIWTPLAGVYRRSGDAARLSALLEETAHLVDDLSERCALRLERARLLARESSEEAAVLLRDILDEDPTQVEAAILLATMLEEAGRTDELGELFALQLDAAKDRADVTSIASISMRLGALLEQRGDDRGARDVYLGAADWDGANRDLLRALVRLSRKRDNAEDLIDALEKLLRTEQGAEAAQLALELSELHGARGDDAAAEAALKAGYAVYPANDRLREELASRYAAREAWHALAELHVLTAHGADGDEARVESLCRAAEILRDRAGDAAAAAELLERALRVAPGDRDVLIALIDACGAVSDHARAARALTATLEASPDDPWLYRARAEIHGALGQGDRAVADLERAYALGGAEYASELVAELERALGRAAARSAEAEAAGAPSEAAAEAAGAASPRALRLRLAEILARSGDVERARAHLGDLLHADSKDRAALKALAGLEESAARWDAASAVYRRLIALEEGDALVATALLLAGACARAGHLGDARGGLERALRAAPGNAEIRDRLRALYAEIGANRELAAITLEDAAAASDVAGRFTLLVAAGRLLLDVGDAAQAAAALREARSLRPEENEVALLLVDALIAAGDSREARAVTAELIVAAKGRRSRHLGAVYHRVARIEDAEGNLHESLTALTRALENDPQNGEIAMELGESALGLGEEDIAARAYRAVTLMKISPEPGEGGTTPAARALAYYHLGAMALAAGDRRKARLMLDKSVSEDGSLEAARALLDELRAG